MKHKKAKTSKAIKKLIDISKGKGDKGDRFSFDTVEGCPVIVFKGLHAPWPKGEEKRVLELINKFNRGMTGPGLPWDYVWIPRNSMSGRLMPVTEETFK